MRRKVYGEGVARRCSLCLFGTAALDGSAVLCERRGVMALDDACRRFRYDPLLRVPRRRPRLSQSQRNYRREDFSL